ncbi:type II/IV secretion system protein, partial [Candidatus Uhrbacteria bacterium]|nr:type II/IV secretion system protein [Candidatus Uhrbacteria bacterium]
MPIPVEKLRDLFVRPGHVSQADFAAAVKEAETAKLPVERVLVDRGLLSDDHLGRTVAAWFDRHFVDLSKVKIADDLLQLIPEAAARAQQAVIFDFGEGVVKVATTNLDNYEFFKLLERKTGRKVEVHYATHSGMDEALHHYSGDRGLLLKKLIADLRANPGDELNIVRLVNVFLEYAHDNRASDIHFEPLEAGVSVRYRIDGVLHEVAAYPKSLHENIVFRIKIMSRLRTDEHEAPQDGRFDFQNDRGRFDVRVSIVPVTTGENVVLRLLAERSRRLPLEDIGLAGSDLEKVRRAAEKPFGMLLVVGPTGSGKTTTLYAALQTLNSSEVNIMTIEDPVEYQIEHVQQIQVNAKKGLTSATGLRSIVRQDPDIIMVGEIRDNDTADIAVNAALTGHLLLSTMHANDAATAFPRFTEMGVEPFLV